MRSSTRSRRRASSRKTYSSNFPSRRRRRSKGSGRPQQAFCSLSHADTQTGMPTNRYSPPCDFCDLPLQECTRSMERVCSLWYPSLNTVQATSLAVPTSSPCTQGGDSVPHAINGTVSRVKKWAADTIVSLFHRQ